MKSKKHLVAGINGFGRFGLHLLRYWLDSRKRAKFSIGYINDDTLTPANILRILKSDSYVSFGDCKISHENNIISILPSDRRTRPIFISVSHAKEDSIPWLGCPDLFLECSGKNTDSKNSRRFLRGKTLGVIISATSWNCDKTLVYGFNHTEYISKKHRVISYGSCTVNAYIPLAHYIHQNYRILSSDVHVIHNVPEYKLGDVKNHTITRKLCTLQESAPRLLPFLNSKNFYVTYTTIPHTGVSMIDMRFHVKHCPSVASFLTKLKRNFKTGYLKNLYILDKSDRGPAAYKFSTYSIVLIKADIKIIGDNIYLYGYFDNENSVSRYFDIVQYIIKSIQKQAR